MQNLHSCRVILKLVRIKILRDSTHHSSVSAFWRLNRRQIMGTLMISIIFALVVDEGVKYLRQIRQEMYNLWVSSVILWLLVKYVS